MIAEKSHFLRLKFGNTLSKIHRRIKLAIQLFNLLNMFREQCIKTANKNG